MLPIARLKAWTIKLVKTTLIQLCKWHTKICVCCGKSSGWCRPITKVLSVCITLHQLEIIACHNADTLGDVCERLTVHYLAYVIRGIVDLTLVHQFFEESVEAELWWKPLVQYSRTTLIRINWDDEPTGYTENPCTWIFLGKQANLAVWSGKKKFYKHLFQAAYLFMHK
jgi:hypothetical protein